MNDHKIVGILNTFFIGIYVSIFQPLNFKFTWLLIGISDK